MAVLQFLLGLAMLMAGYVSLAIWFLQPGSDPSAYYFFAGGGSLLTSGFLLLKVAMSQARSSAWVPPEPSDRPRGPTPVMQRDPAPPDFELCEIVAERWFEFLGGGGDETPVAVRFGRPRQSDRLGGWLCPYEIEGLGSLGPRVAYGIDSVEALMLAMHQAPLELENLMRLEGGRLYWQGARRLGFRSTCQMLRWRKRRRSPGEKGYLTIGPSRLRHHAAARAHGSPRGRSARAF